MIAAEHELHVVKPAAGIGYSVGNDITARDLQKADKQWARAKGYDTFCPIGPWIVTHLTLDEAGAQEFAAQARTMVITGQQEKP